MFVIPDECKPYMAMQVTEYKDDPHAPWNLAVKEAALYCDWLPVNPRYTLDIGCGLGRTTVMLHGCYGRALADDSYEYILADASLVDAPLVGGWLPAKREWCNDMEATGLFLRANGIAECNYHLINLDAACERPSHHIGARLDLVISTLAIGFHWPLETWLSELQKISHSQTVLIFGVRHGKYDGDSAFDGFQVIGFAESGWKQDFLALRKA